MSITLYPASQRQARRWRNGGGITSNVAVFPPDASDDSFLWRVSLAEVTEASAFSAWPKVERHLRLLSGAMKLHINGKVYDLSPSSETIIFSGDDEVYGEPITPCRVFNLMLRAGEMTTTLRRTAEAMQPSADHLLLLALQPTMLHLSHASYALAPQDALLLDAENAAQPIQPSSALIVTEISKIVTG